MAVLARLGDGHGSELRVAALGSAAARLLRAYATQVEVLRRLRHGGQEYVRVEHVYVNDGGQGVIGNVKQPEALAAAGRASRKHAEAAGRRASGRARPGATAAAANADATRAIAREPGIKTRAG
jgi:hypothetical protein